jgi:NADPH:quinone reductase-like Zn-dependent oxidoreductase
MGIFSWQPNRPQDLDTLRGLIDDGRIKPLLDRRFALDEAPEAVRYLAEGRARGKLLVVP